MVENNLSAASIGNTLRSALLSGMIREEDTSAILYDLSYLESRIKHLTSCFPENTLHGIAIKANPLVRILEFMKGIAPNIGAEAASIGEVTMALKTGYRPDQIVYDSPVKTMQELEFALKTGLHINVDNLSELNRVAMIYQSRSANVTSTGSVGLRINPQIGLGTILESSVAGEYSKFGVPLRHQRAQLEQAFLTHAWLTGVHLHVGSQGCPMEMLVDGIGALYDFTMVVNAKRRNANLHAIDVFDIGGGLPVAYNTISAIPSMEEYVGKIRRRAPQLFNTTVFKLITEFGRWTCTNAGWTVSRVEYVKHDQSINTAMLHVGADLFLRECLNPKDWHHQYTLFDREGRIKEGKDVNLWNLAGPLCFSGDMLAKEVCLPPVEEGDYLVIHDSGGYTFSMWSRYNSRQTPRIIGYREDRFEILKERETLEELLGFWE